MTSAAPSALPVALIGRGNMGGPMVRRLLSPVMRYVGLLSSKFIQNGYFLNDNCLVIKEIEQVHASVWTRVCTTCPVL